MCRPRFMAHEPELKMVRETRTKAEKCAGQPRFLVYETELIYRNWFLSHEPRRRNRG